MLFDDCGDKFNCLTFLLLTPRGEAVPQLGKLIARGHTAEIYIWGAGKVVKLFNEGFPEKRVHDEARITRVLQDTNLTPKVGEVLRLGQRLGIIYEHLHGRSLAETLRADPASTLSLARQFAELHARVHTLKNIVSLPSQLEVLERKISGVALLAPESRRELIARLPSLP
jgi:hypothetical protein